MLIGAIRALSKEGTVVYSCMEHRFDGCSEFYSGMRAAGFDVHRIPQKDHVRGPAPGNAASR